MPADGVPGNGRIEESRDGGKTRQPASTGLAAAPWSKHMVERFGQMDNDLFAVLSDGALWRKRLDEPLWHRVLAQICQIKAIAAVK